MKRLPKGCFGYLKSERRFQVIKTAIFFIIPITLFIAGWITTKSRLNLLTVVAILGMLPAGKSLVGCIMLFRAWYCPKEVYDKVSSQDEEVKTVYELNITTYKNLFHISSLCCGGKAICAYTPQKNTPSAEFEKYIKNTLEANSYKGYTVKLFCDLDKYYERRESLKNLETEQDDEIDRLLSQICCLSL